VVSSLRFSPDGQQLVTAARDGSAKIWDVATQQLRHVLNHPAGVLSLAVSRDGRWIATGSEDGTVQIWDAGTGQAHGGPLQHDEAVYHGMFSPDSAYLLTGGRDRTARIWRVADGAPVRPPLRHTASVIAVHWCTDQPRFLTGDLQGNLKHWARDAADLPLESWSLPDLQVNAARYLPGGTLVAATFNRQVPRESTAADGGIVGVWELATSKLLAPLWPHRDSVFSLDVSPDGTLLLTAGADGVAHLWPLRPAEQSVEELVRVAQLLSGRRIDHAVNLVALDAATLRREFLDLRDQHAACLSTSPEDAANWERWLAALTPNRPQRVP
jgi:WD40 repeat protein